MKDLLEISKAVVVGHAVADALGVPVEFKKRSYLDDNPVVDMMGYGTHYVPAGCWSDDTSMSLCTLDSLVNGVNYADMMQKFCEWYGLSKYTATGAVFDCGITTSNALSQFSINKLPPLECGFGEKFDNGNGSLMRVNPLALYLYNRPIDLDLKIEIVHNVSKLTHSHERSLVGCGIYCFVLWGILDNPTKAGVEKGLLDAIRYYKSSPELITYYRIFDMDFYKADRSQVKSTGYVVDTLEASLWCLMTTDNYKDCVLKAVNLGDDTDTVAAVAGGLAGALYGYDSIPLSWRNQLLKLDYIESLCAKVFG